MHAWDQQGDEDERESYNGFAGSLALILCSLALGGLDSVLTG